MQKENKDNLTDLVGMVSKPQPKPDKEPKPQGTLTSQDGKPVTLGAEDVHQAALPSTNKQSNRKKRPFFFAMFVNPDKKE